MMKRTEKPKLEKELTIKLALKTTWFTDLLSFKEKLKLV